MPRKRKQKHSTLATALAISILVAMPLYSLAKQIMPYLIIALWVIIGAITIMVLTVIAHKIHNRQLLKTVTKTNRGTPSERRLVIHLLKQQIPPQSIFHDLYLNKHNGQFSQIDLVAVTNQAIIVFEVKDYSGWIYGNAHHSQWTRVLAYGKNKYRFYNPIMQNNQHIQSLKTHLNQPSNIPFYSVIVFYGNCELKDISYVPQNTYLVKAKRLTEVLKIIANSNQPAHYTNKPEMVDKLTTAVQNGNNPQIQKQHIQNINNLLGKNRIFD